MAPDGRYAALHARSLAEPEAFWGEAAAGLDWERPADMVLDRAGTPLAGWFSGGMLNICWNALDRHVRAGHGDRPAIL